MHYDDIKNLRGQFGWTFGKEFFIETKTKGNFIWSDPDYYGDNTMKRTKMTLGQFCKSRGIPYVRDKGHHSLLGYCGEGVKVLDP